MSAQKRLMIYAASVAPGGVEHFTTQIAASLGTVLKTRGWALSVLARPVNTLGLPLSWPVSTFQMLTQEISQSSSERVYLNANTQDFAQLTGKGGIPFDVLYLPSPWRNIPLGLAEPIPAPVVISLHDLEFERTDYGIMTDQHRREAEKFAKLASAFIFSSNTIRDEAVQRYGFPIERTHVIYQAPTLWHGLDEQIVRQKYNLPEKFAFTLRWLSPRKNGRTLIEAFALLKARGQLSLPLVTAGFSFDDVLPYNVAHQRYQESCKALIRDSQFNQGDVIELGVVEQEDIPALLGAASVVIAPSLSEAGLSYLLLDAMAQVTPILYSRIPVFTERLGDDGRYGLSFDPTNPEELAEKIHEVIQCMDAAQARAVEAQRWVTQRSQLDVALDYSRVFEAVSASPWRSRPKQRPKLMVGREERMAWLINHTTLRDAELPIIRSFGMEVYTSKELPDGNEFRTASVDYSEDEHSTLPNWVLERLNRHNFYEEGVPNEIAEILNGYFGTVVVTSYFPPLRDLVRNYRGRILVRVFGREQPHNYSEYFTYMGQGDFWRHAWAVQHRLWFTPCYDSIAPIEEKFLRDRTVILPLALPDRILRAENRWVGTDRRVMFLCPRIKTAPGYYGRFYEEFKQHLGHLPHIIPGHQPIPVDDPNVTGYVTDDQMQAWFRELRVMFYHSREPRHLHYHPLEAVAYGMPLIFMKGGLVEQLMGPGVKPGGCDTYEEAESKLRRILDGDDAFTRAVIESQIALLDTFRPQYVRNVWEKNFIGNIMKTPRVVDVLPFADWVTPNPEQYGTTDKTELVSGRKVGMYALTVPGGGVYKYITGLVDAAARLGEQHAWSFELRWGLPISTSTTYSPPTWPIIPPSTLRIFDLSTTDDGREAPPPTNSDEKVYVAPPHKLPRQLLKATGVVVRWRASTTYLSNRPIRVLSEAFIIPAQWMREAFYQRTLHPQNTGLRLVLQQSRLGRRLLKTGIGIRLDSPVSVLPVALPNTPEVVEDHSYLVNAPPYPGCPPLLEKQSPPNRPYITLDEIKNMTERYDVVYFPNPFRMISPNIDINTVEELPVAITMFDLAHEFTEAWGPNAESVSREMAIWSRLAQKIIFCSDFIREEAIKRYGIPEEKTHVVRQPPMVIHRVRPTEEDIRRVKTKLGLPDSYLLNIGFQGTHKNNIAIFEAIRILRWRGYMAPPLVIGGVDARRLVLGDPIGEYLIALQQVIRSAGFKHGEDFFVVDYISEEDLSAVYAGSSINISVSRSEAGLHGMVTESMLYQTPLVISSIRQNTDEFGTGDDYALIVPPDDPVALADAIQHTLKHPEETAQRVMKAYQFICERTWYGNADEYLHIFEQIAARRNRPNER